MEQISGLTSDEAKQLLLDKVEVKYRRGGTPPARLGNQNQGRSDEKARGILSHVIQRSASEIVSETTASVVNIPNDEMKGRLIGREGRNIRATGTGHRRRPYYRRYSRSGNYFQLRPGTPCNCLSGSQQTDSRRPYSSGAYRRNRCQDQRRGGNSHRAGGRTGGFTGRCHQAAPRAYQAPGAA